jgi:hypothetical protein
MTNKNFISYSLVIALITFLIIFLIVGCTEKNNNSRVELKLDPNNTGDPESESELELEDVTVIVSSEYEGGTRFTKGVGMELWALTPERIEKIRDINYESTKQIIISKEDLQEHKDYNYIYLIVTSIEGKGRTITEIKEGGEHNIVVTSNIVMFSSTYMSADINDIYPMDGGGWELDYGTQVFVGVSGWDTELMLLSTTIPIEKVERGNLKLVEVGHVEGIDGKTYLVRQKANNIDSLYHDEGDIGGMLTLRKRENIGGIVKEFSQDNTITIPYNEKITLYQVYETTEQMLNRLYLPSGGGYPPFKNKAESIAVFNYGRKVISVCHIEGEFNLADYKIDS